MKKLWLCPVIFVTALLLYPVFSFSDYVIHLKNGRQFVTNRHWEEGGEIKFHFKRGVLGVPKDAVVSIEEVIPQAPVKKEVPPEAAPSQETPPDTTPAEEKKESEKVKEAVKKTEKEAVKEKDKKAEDTKPIHEYWAQKNALKVKLDEADRRLREATRNKDKAAKKRAREDRRKFSKEIHKLIDEVKKINNGKLPEYWWQD